MTQNRKMSEMISESYDGRERLSHRSRIGHGEVIALIQDW